MKAYFHLIVAIGVFVALFVLTVSTFAQDEKPKSDGSAPAAQKPAADKPADDDKTPAPTADDVEKQLRDKLKPRPDDAPPAPDPNDAAQPDPPKPDPDDKSADQPDAPARRIEVIPPTITNVGGVDQPDPRIVGLSPGDAPPTLRREGEFIVNRRGRLVRTGDGAIPIFSFDADTDKAAETPVFIMPCRLLQNMEDLTARHGQDMVFVVSGQVFAYRGGNYLLPTMMKPAIDKGNLRQ